MQFQADILNCKIIRPKIIESTAQGVAHLAGIAVGLWKDKNDLRKLHAIDKTFSPRMKNTERNKFYSGWLAAVRRTLCE